MFNDKDKALHKGLMKILDEATFTLKAREVAAFVQIYNWVKEMPSKTPDKKAIKKLDEWNK